MRKAEIERNTKETQISLKLNLDGSGNCKIKTGIGYFDHSLEAMAMHGFMDIELSCKGDLHVDAHHTVEDVGIVLGQAIAKAIGDKKGIRRYASCFVPMDEALVLCALDLSGRAYMEFDLELPPGAFIGTMDGQLFEEFFRAIAFNAGITLHMKQMNGRNLHHIVEAACKAFGRALADALQHDARVKGIPSTKGVLGE